MSDFPPQPAQALRSSPRAPHGARAAWLALALFGVGVAVWGLFDVPRRARIDPANPGANKTDFSVYIEASKAFFDGRDPYAVVNIRGWNYLYPPLFALLLAPLRPLPPQTQALVWFFVSLALWFGCLYECRRLVLWLAARDADEHPPASFQLKTRVPFWIGAAAFFATLLPSLNCLQRGQVGFALLYPLLLGYRLTMQNRGWLGVLFGGVLLALPVAIKLTPILPAAFVLLQLFGAAVAPNRPNVNPRAGRPWRRTAAAMAGFVSGLGLFFLAGPALFIGWNANLGHLETWWRQVVRNPNLNQETGMEFRSPRNQSLDNAVFHFENSWRQRAAGPPASGDAGAVAETPAAAPSGPTHLRRSLPWLYAALVGFLLAAALHTVLTRDLLGQAAAVGLACVLTLLLSPVSWGHHFVLLLPAAAWLPVHPWRAGRRRLAVLLALGPFVLTSAHYAAVETLGRWGLLGFGTAVWFGVGCVLLLCGRRPARFQKRPFAGSQRRTSASDVFLPPSHAELGGPTLPG